MRPIPHPLPILLLSPLLLSIAACGGGDPDERVAAARAQYSVSLESFVAEKAGPAGEPASEAVPGDQSSTSAEAAATATAAEAANAAEAAEGEGAETPADEPGPKTADVLLHLLVQFSGEEPLPGITVEVTQTDRSGGAKPPTRHWVETGGITGDEVKQVDLQLESIAYEDGDAFSVTLRQNIPAVDREQYREFAGTAP